jgi:Xaa-Pro dipeptidase
MAGVFTRGPGTLNIDRAAFHGPIREGVVRRFQALAPATTTTTPTPTTTTTTTGAPAQQQQQQQPHRPRLLLLKAGDVLPVYDTDGEILLRQEAFFHYLFGVEEESFYGALDLDSGQTALFAPRLPDFYGVWFGKMQPPSFYKERYAVDYCAYKDELPAWLAKIRPSELHVLAGKNSDSGSDASILAPPDAEELARNSGAALVRGGAAFDALVEARVHKTPQEAEVIAYVNAAASKAHVSLMHECGRRYREQQEKGDGKGEEEGQQDHEIMREFQLEALFQYETYSQHGCRFQGYTPIVASGPHGAVLHYGHSGAPNDGPVLPRHVVLVDAGCEFYRYTSDITCSWPADGSFSPDQKIVYESVLAAHSAVLAAARPGVLWPDMHTLACRAILSGLKEGGLLRGDVEEMLACELGGVFMPHGLGHFLGLSTHDCGGYGVDEKEEAEKADKAGGGHRPSSSRVFPARIDRPGYRSLRTARALEEGMVVTVEPGAYFNFAALLDPILQQQQEEEEQGAAAAGDGAGEKEGGGEEAAAAALLRRRQLSFLVPEALARFRDFGGVRLEDNVLITADGCRSFTNVPRAVGEVEAVIAGGAWPPSSSSS